MEIITSSKNERVKTFKKMIDDKSHFFLDSPKLIKEAMLGKYELTYVIVDESRLEKIKEIFDFNSFKTSQIIYVSNSVFKSLSTSVVWSQGIIAIVDRKELKLAKPENNFLVLDELQDPGNVGTLIRSAVGSGFNDIYLLNCAGLANEKVVRSTMGAIFKGRIYETSRSEFINLFNSLKPKPNLVVADMNGENLYKADITQPCGVVVGNEGNGISKEMMALANKVVSIPMQGNLESLNAGVSGSIVMFQVANK